MPRLIFTGAELISPVDASEGSTYLVGCQDSERCHNLLSSVCVRSLSGHKVNERLEGHNS